MWVTPGHLDLTYCTNIHAGESWNEVEASVQQYAPQLKAALSPAGPFGLGLRLSAVAARELRRGDRLVRFKSYLQEHDMYVAIINGFPYGSFHGEAVKEKVFTPDWSDAARTDYTLDLIEILAAFLEGGSDGGISTMPLSYKPWHASPGAAPWDGIIRNLIRVVVRLIEIRQRTGKTIHIDIEPEPNGLVESTEEFIAFFTGPLRHIGEPLLREAFGVSSAEAREHLYRHLQICFDVCHMAVAFESPVSSLELLAEHGIGVGRVQISSALRVALDGSAESDAQRLKDLATCVEPVYLHQVVERTRLGDVQRYADLDEALAVPLSTEPREWRIHFHVPIFADGFGTLQSTQRENEAVLRAIASIGCTHHLEVETYTWGVLPVELQIDMAASIERELRWVMDRV